MRSGRIWIWILGLLIAAGPAAAGQAAEWPTERPPAPLPAPPVAFPPYDIRTLPNGLQVIAVLQHEQPVVTMRLLVRAGAAQDPDGKSGVAYLTAQLLDEGTGSRSAHDVARLIDDVGGAIGTGSGADLSFANVTVMTDSFAAGMDLLADVARHPSFAPDEIARQRQQATASLRVRADDPDALASDVFDRLVYGSHPYGLPGTGTPETLARITQADLQSFHRRYYVPNNMILAVVGDVSREAAFAAAERAFGAWPRAPLAERTRAALPAPAPRIVVVDKPDAVQTEIRAGMLAMARTDPDWLAWDLAVRILGGEGVNRLHQVLRTARGLTYSASAAAEGMRQAGDLMAQTDTRTAATGETVRLMVDEFARLRRDRVGPEELGEAEEYLAGSFPLTIETPNDIATQVLNVVFYQLPVSELATFRKRVIAVTPDDIQRVAQNYIRPDQLSIVLVGDARAIVPQLQSVGFTDVDVVPIDQVDVTSPTLGRAPADEAHALLARVIAAKGGLEALQRVRTVEADADTALQMPQGSVPSTTRTYIAYPDRYRVDASVAGANIVQVYNAGTAWVKDPSGVHAAPPAMRDDFAASVRRDTFPLLIGAAAGRLSVRLGDDLRTPGGQSLRALEISGSDLAPVTLYIDDHDLIARQAYTSPGPTGAPVHTEEVFSDYRTVDGVLVPFRAQLLRDGVPILDRRLTSVTLNTPIAEALFAQPAP